jgi:hypothetical protein
MCRNNKKGIWFATTLAVVAVFMFALAVSVPVAQAEEPVELATVRIGLLGSSNDQYWRDYFSHLKDEIRKKPNREVREVPEVKSYYSVETEMAKILGQKYQIDMLIVADARYQGGHGWRSYTKLVDISGQRLVELKPVRIGDGGWPFPPRWEKKLVKRQIGAIEKIIDEISGEKRKSKP